MKSIFFVLCLFVEGIGLGFAQDSSSKSGNNAERTTPTELAQRPDAALSESISAISPDNANANANANANTSALPVLTLSWPKVRPQAQPRNDECVPYAAAFHQVSDSILRAILLVESGMNPNTINKNANGSVDLGLGGMNSVHFQELAKYGIAPEHLLNACVATYVTAWQLKKQFTQYGVSWFAIGAYHSHNPYYNQRYQILIYNQLLKLHALQGAPLPVPPLAPKPG